MRDYVNNPQAFQLDAGDVLLGTRTPQLTAWSNLEADKQATYVSLISVTSFLFIKAQSHLDIFWL